MKRERIASGTKWEAMVGYSRAVRVGACIHVSGTTATDESGEVVGARCGGSPEISPAIAKETKRFIAPASAVVRKKVRLTN